MSKNKVLRNNLSSAKVRALTTTFYLNKYYSLYMNRYKIEGVDYQARDFILRSFWGIGTIACFKLMENSDLIPPNENLIFAPYSPNNWNIYDYPVSANIINKKGVKFFPSRPLIVDKEVVLGWCQGNKKSVAQMVEYFVEKIVNIEIVIDINLNAHKMPFLVASAPEDTKKMAEIVNLLEDDAPSLFVGLTEADKIKALVSGAPYIIDKLYTMKQAEENELREYLGLNNLGGAEKKEHLITSEVDVNNEVIESSGMCFIDYMKDFFDRVNELFGTSLSIEVNEPKQDDPKEIEMEDEEDEEI